MNSATVVSRRIRARSGEGERLREEILTATEQLLLELGDDGAVSVRAVAERVGCTAPSIYMHFDDKTDLLFEVCSRVFRALDEDIAAATSELAGTVERLAAGHRAFIRFGLRYPEHYRILFMGKPILTADQWADLRLSGVAGFERLTQRCQACIDAGEFAIDDANLAATYLWSAGHGFVSLRISKPGFDWPDETTAIEHLVHANIEGLRRK